LWKRYGTSLSCDFATEPQSLSRRVFDAYVQKRFPAGVAAESWAEDSPSDAPLPELPECPNDPGLTPADEDLLRKIWRELEVQELRVHESVAQEWDESKYERDRSGKFARKGTGVPSQADPAMVKSLAAIARGEVSERAKDLVDDLDDQMAMSVMHMRKDRPELRAAEIALDDVSTGRQPSNLEAWAAGTADPRLQAGLDTLAESSPEFYPEPITMYRTAGDWQGEGLSLWTDSIATAEKHGGVAETREVLPTEIAFGPRQSIALNRERRYVVRDDPALEKHAAETLTKLQAFAEQLGEPGYVNANEAAGKAVQALNEKTGADWSPKDLAKAGGAIEGAKVFLYAGRAPEVVLDIEGDGYHCNRTIQVDERGDLEIVNHELEVYPGRQGAGLGTKVLAQEVAACERMGVRRIKTQAGRGPNMNGYYTWPRVGYDAELDADEWARMAVMGKYEGEAFKGQSPAQIKDAIRQTVADLKLPVDRSFRLSDMMKTAAGRAAWKRFGISIACEFDPRPGSLSRRTFDAYVKEKFPDMVAAESWSSLWSRTRKGWEMPEGVEEFDVGPEEDEDLFGRIWDQIALEDAGGRRSLQEGCVVGRVQVLEKIGRASCRERV
jgi:GNAT superfamily N-acetyltransferase